jgi:hypothetical protein
MRLCRSLLASLLTGLMACLPLLGTNGGILNPMAGTVQVNGAPALAGSAVVAGDLVSISPDGSARLTFRGASVVAAAKTVLRLERGSIRLNFGMVQVAGGVPIVSNGHSVTPVSGDSRYAVIALGGGRTYVEALSGGIKVRAYGRIFTVPSGTAMKFQDQNVGQTQTQTITPEQTQQQPATPDQTQTQQQTTTPDQTQQQQTTPPPPSEQTTTPATQEQTTTPATQEQTTTPEQNPPAGTEQTTTTETTVQTEQGAAAGGGGLGVPLTIALVAAAAVATGIIVHEATKSNSTSPSQ